MIHLSRWSQYMDSEGAMHVEVRWTVGEPDVMMSVVGGLKCWKKPDGWLMVGWLIFF